MDDTKQTHVRISEISFFFFTIEGQGALDTLTQQIKCTNTQTALSKKHILLVKVKIEIINGSQNRYTNVENRRYQSLNNSHDSSGYGFKT